MIKGTIERVKLPAVDPEAQTDAERRGIVEYTPSSIKAVVIAVAHMLDHFADDTHRGLDESRNKRRRIANTSVLVYPNFGEHPNIIGYQLFVVNPDDSIINEGASHAIGVAFDLRAYEAIGDKYLFSMLNKITQSISEQHRPGTQRLKELSARYMLAN